MRAKHKTIIAVIIFAAVCAAIALPSGKEQGVKRSIFAMDTYMELTVYGHDAEAALDAAENEIMRLDGLLSTGNLSSEVSQLNNKKSGVLSKDCRYLFERSKQINEMTDGAFDITIYPLMEAWGFAGGDFRVPDDDELSRLLKYVGMSLVEYDDETGELKMPQQMKLDFGGIGKGYASQRVTELMRGYDIDASVISLGGNVQTFGRKPDKSKWKIAVKNPDDTSSYIGVLSVMDKAVVTSGGYERFFEKDGVSYHHIIDPRTGRPANSGLLSVTVVCGDGTLADGLSTALYVLGMEKAVDLWRSHSNEFDMILVDSSKKQYVTDGISNLYDSEADYEIIY